MDAAELRTVCDGVDAVCSALGASVLPDFAKGRHSYFAVDTRANRNLIDTARTAGVRKFVYVSVACYQVLGELAYVRAHEDVVATLAESGMAHVVVRPTGFFSAFGALVAMALKGRIPIIGDGSARTNPIHDADVAAACIDAIENEGTELELGGPDVLSRREIVEAAFRAVGKPVNVTAIPYGVARLMSYLMRPINPRMAQLTQFFATASVKEVVAPARGTRRLADYFAQVATAIRQ